METVDFKYQKAKMKVQTIKGFYTHLTVYILVNLIIFVINMLAAPDSLWFFWPLLGWGIAVGLHALRAFGSTGEEWEEKKIREIMENEN